MRQGSNNTVYQASSSNLPIKTQSSSNRPLCTSKQSINDHPHFDRRSFTASLLAIITTTPNLPADAANVTPPPPLALSTFNSSEGFSFTFPSNWVVAFDRSSPRGNGKVGDPITVVGDYSKTYATASVFRSPPPPPPPSSSSSSGQQIPSLAQAQALCLDPIASEPGTMMFRVDKSELDSTGTVFSFQYYLETCSGEEWEEGKNGQRRCLNALGMDAAVKKRNYIGRYIVLDNGRAYTITASVNLEQFEELKGVLNGVVESFMKSV